VSRVERAVLTPHQRELAQTLRRLMAAWRDVRDLVEVGAYAAGSDPVIDVAIRLRPVIEAFLRQPPEEVVPVAESWQALAAMLGQGSSR
jgi:flagellum-specific ATP synthase